MNNGTLEGIVFQQDGATSHTARETRQFLEIELQGAGLISLRTNFEWPPRSPDLTECDFWLWGHLKHIVFQTIPRNAAELLARIETECRRLENEEPEVFENVR